MGWSRQSLTWSCAVCGFVSCHKVELLLFENESGDGSTVMYDLPSSLMAIERNPALRDAAQELGCKLQTLVSRVTGAELDRTPEQMDHQN
ncbi:hypothetical protein KSZ_50040 [Dictyobacter formicarum]|uniref:Uncharacterized protein n=1 Tax=Dictyobacter formicarum TaxID=2778368 RepID=A0ABQ3VMF8_9CHLR|nr:hypothetical protein KSZ_50040 [Dictyobacter formicarum]